jgi:hypothetical protein
LVRVGQSAQGGGFECGSDRGIAGQPVFEKGLISA